MSVAQESKSWSPCGSFLPHLACFIGQTLADDCYRSEEMINSANARIEMTAEQIFKEIEALPKSERERLVHRMRESDIPQDFIDALDDFNQQRFVSMETALNETPPDA